MSVLANKLKFNFSREFLLTVVAVALISLLTAANYYTEINLLWLYLIFLLPVGIIILRCPESGIYALIFSTLIFERWFTLQSIHWAEWTIKFYPLDVIILFILIAVVWRAAVRRQFIWRDKNLGWAVWLFVAVIFLYFIRSLFVGNIDLALSFSTLKNFVLYSVIYWLIINVIKNKIQFDRFIKTFLIAGVGLIYFILWGLLHGYGLWIEYTPLSTWGTRLLGGPHSYYLVILIILLISLFVNAKEKSYQQYFYLALLAIFSLGLIGSLQRHLWLGLLLGLVILFYFYQPAERKKFSKLILLGLIIILIAVSFSFWLASWQLDNPLLSSDFFRSIKLRLYSFFTTPAEDSSAIWRIASWQQAQEWFKDNWLLGIGLGQRLHFEVGGVDHYIPLRDLHNDFISIAVQLGVVGLGFFFYLIIRIIKMFFNYHSRLSAPYRFYFLSFFTLIIIFLWLANFNVYLDLNLYVIFFWIFLAGLTISRTLGLKQGK